MAIDLIEDSDMSAHAQSRMGNGFADEREVYNDGQWSNVAGFGAIALLRNKNKNKRAAKSYEEDAMRGLPDLTNKMDCLSIDIAIEKAQASMDARRGMITAGAKAKLQQGALKGLEAYIGKARAIKADLQCERIAEEQQKRQDQTETQNILQQVTAGAGVQDSTPEQAAKAKQNRYIIYGIGGLLALGAIILLLKPSKS